MTDTNAERAIGRLEGKLDALADAVANQTEKSEQGMARMYREIESLREEATESRRNISGMKEELAGHGPTIAEIKKWKERLIGMQMLSAFVAASFGGILVAGWKWLAVKAGWQ